MLDYKAFRGGNLSSPHRDRPPKTHRRKSPFKFILREIFSMGKNMYRATNLVPSRRMRKRSESEENFCRWKRTLQNLSDHRFFLASAPSTKMQGVAISPRNLVSASVSASN